MSTNANTVMGSEDGQSELKLEHLPSAFTRLRVRVEDADQVQPGDSPPGPAIPLNPVKAPAKELKTSLNSHSSLSLPSAPLERPLRHRNSTSAADGMRKEPRLMSVIPLDTERLEARLVYVRLQAVQMGNQLLAAQWAAPGRGGRGAAPFMTSNGHAFSNAYQGFEPLPPILSYPRKPAPHAPSAHSFLSQPVSILHPHVLSNHPQSNFHPLQPSHRSSPAHSNHNPFRPGPPTLPRSGSSRSLGKAPSKSWSRAPSASASRNNSQPLSRAQSRCESETDGKRSSHEQTEVEMEAALPSPIIEPEVIKSTSKRLVQLIEQRQRQVAEAAKAAAAKEEGSPRLDSAVASEGDLDNDNKLERQTRKPKYSLSDLQGKALAEKALATIEKALRMLLQVQEAHGSSPNGFETEQDSEEAIHTDSLQCYEHQLRNLHRDLTGGSKDHDPEVQAAGSTQGHKHVLPPLCTRHASGNQDNYLLSQFTHKPGAPPFPSQPGTERKPSRLKLSSDPGDHEGLSLVEAAQWRAHQTNPGIRLGQFRAGQQANAMEVEAKMRKGLRTAKKILKGLKDQQKKTGKQGGQSSSSLVESGDTSDEELTEQEHVYGRGIWGIFGNPAVGDTVTIPAVPPTPDGERYSGAFGRIGKQRQRLIEEESALCSRNPVAYDKDLARQSEDQIRNLAMQAHMKLRGLDGPRTDPQSVQEFMKSIKLLQSLRPFYLPPLYAREHMKRKSLKDDGRQSQRTWSISKSVFEMRRLMNEGHDIVDTDKVKRSQFDLDYSRVAAKPLFQKLLTRIDETARHSSCTGSLEQDIHSVHEQMAAYRDQLRSIFIFYSCVASRFASEDQGRMSLSSWLQFCSDATIMNNAQKGCTRADLATVFVAVKGGTDSKSSEALKDDAMMRFEFYEGVARAAHGKFIEPKHLDELSDAVVMLIEACVLPNVPREALLDPNIFRNERLHTEPMAKFLTDQEGKNWSFLNALFKVFKAKDRTKYFRVEHWGSFLEANKLLAHQAGLDKRDAKLIFCWSQLSVMDELKKRKRAVAMTLMDFVEAVCRLAEHQALPSEADLDNYFLHEHGLDPKKLALGLGYRLGNHSASTATSLSPSGTVLAPAAALANTMDTSTEANPSLGSYMPDEAASPSRPEHNNVPKAGTQTAGGLKVQAPNGLELPSDASIYAMKLQEFYRFVAASGQRGRRPSAGLLSKPTRPLELKVGLMLTNMLGHMRALYGGQDQADITRKMLHEATMISGGIEMA